MEVIGHQNPANRIRTIGACSRRQAATCMHGERAVSKEQLPVFRRKRDEVNAPGLGAAIFS
jgi:hypothetical protein